MLKQIKKFYEQIKLKSNEVKNNESPSYTHSHVFYKEYPRFPKEKINYHDLEELGEIIEQRESTREFSEDPLPKEDIEKILSSHKIVDNTRFPERRTYPSGGARFPVETYIISYNVDGLNPGAYHYNILKGKLEKVLDRDISEKSKEINSPFLHDPAASIILTSALPRAEVKYGPKALPISYIEAGHIAQNINLVCAKEDIGCCNVAGYVDDTIKEILDLTEDEIPIYAIGVGNKGVTS